MYPHKEGYDFIAVNFGGWHLCKTLEEANTVAENMKPDAGNVYQRGFYSERLQMVVGKDRWFPVQRA